MGVRLETVIRTQQRNDLIPVLHTQNIDVVAAADIHFHHCAALPLPWRLNLKDRVFGRQLKIVKSIPGGKTTFCILLPFIVRKK